MRIGCLFGTFDPPHNGHLRIAAWMRDHEALDEVWLVVTPRNPFKLHRTLSPDAVRMAMVRAAVHGLDRFVACDEELVLDPPNYTADSLAHFRAKWPHHGFDLIIGSDNLASFHRWQDPEDILAHHRLLVYPRPGSPVAAIDPAWRDHRQVKITDAPPMDISSTLIRAAIRRSEPVKDLVPDAVRAIIEENSLYR